MKTLLALLFLALSLPAFAQPQGVSMRSTNGSAFGATTHFRATSNHFAGKSTFVGPLNATNPTNRYSSGVNFMKSSVKDDGNGEPMLVFSPGVASIASTNFLIFNDGQGVWAPLFSGIGSGLTTLNADALSSGTVPDPRLPTSVFTNIAEMSASAQTQRVAYVQGYWGTNTYGGGFFRHYPQAATTNFGTIFTNVNGGNWRRDRPEGTNFWRVEWFGIPPMNTDNPATRFDAYQRLTNLFAVAGNWSTVQFPPYGVMVTYDPGPTNARGMTIKGSGSGHLTELAYPNKASWIAYQGAGGAGSKLFSMWNAYKCVIEGIGFETSTPVYSGGTYYVTNNAETALDFDQSSPNIQICTDNIIRGCYFKSRGTNVNWTGLSISRTSAANCENFLMEDLGFGGNGNIDLVATGNSGECIFIGPSSNSRQHILRKINMVNHQYGLHCQSGGVDFSGGNGDGLSFAFRMTSWAATCSIRDFFGEWLRQSFYIGNGAAGIPMKIENYRATHGNSLSNLALIEITGGANIEMSHSGFYSSATQRVFSVTAGQTATLDSKFNRYGLGYAVNDYYFGLTNFYRWRIAYDDANSFVPAVSAGYNLPWQMLVYDAHATYLSNRVVMDIPSLAAPLRLAPGTHRVHIGSPSGTLNAYDFAVDSGSTAPPALSFGDQTIVSRIKLLTTGNVNDTVLEVHATNTRSATLLLKEDSSAAQLMLVADNNRNHIRFIGGSGLQIRQGTDNGATAHAVFNANGTTDFFPTNVGIGVKVNGWLAASNLSSSLTMPTNGILWQGGAQLTNIYTATATLDFGNAATIGCSDLTMTVTGAALGDVVDLGVPNASVVANSSFSAWVSAADTVTVRYCALISGDPASGVFRAEVHKWK